jgi:hypothetical protein
MADVVYLHVGAPKTGTTFLQDRLYANRAALAARGIHYPVGAQRDMFAPALDLIDRSWGGQREGVRGEWESLVLRVRRTSGTAIVSHEILAGATQEQVRRAQDSLRGAEVHLVYSARDLGRQIPAEWQELVKHRSTKRFRRFLREVQEADRRDSDLWFWRAQGLPDVLSRWSSGLPPERVHLVTVPQPGSSPGELWRRYCTAFGFDPVIAPAEVGRANSSIGIDEAALVRRLNQRLRRAGLDSATYRRLVREVVVHQTLSERSKMRRIVLPPHARGWAARIADEWVEWVEGSGIHVVGDVEELRPVYADEEWVNPDRAKPRRVAEAALEALAAVVLEAERSAPESTPGARIGRAARRLRGQ